MFDLSLLLSRIETTRYLVFCVSLCIVCLFVVFLLLISLSYLRLSITSLLSTNVSIKHCDDHDNDSSHIPGRVGSSCSTSGTRRDTLVVYQMFIYLILIYILRTKKKLKMQTQQGCPFERRGVIYKSKQYLANHLHSI